MERLDRWLALARAVGARRFFINGSFVTEKAEVDMWDGWVEFFSGTREPDARRKGVVEVAL